MKVDDILNFKAYWPGDIVVAHGNAPEAKKKYEAGLPTWAKVVSVKDGVLKLDRPLCVKDGVLMETPVSEVFLSQRPLEVGETYYIATEHNIVVWRITEVEEVDCSMYGPMNYYTGERSIAGGKFKEDSKSSFSEEILSGRFFKKESEARRKHADLMRKRIDELQEEIQSLKDELLAESFTAQKLEKEGK